MKIEKRPIDPERIRSIPVEGFSWIDRRFVRQGFIDRLSGESILLYLFLSTVADHQGLSFYADSTIGRLLKLDAEQITRARAELLKSLLILHRHPIYQVLPLGCNPQPLLRPRRASVGQGGELTSLREIFQEAWIAAKRCDE